MNIKPLNVKYVCFLWAMVVCLFATTVTSCGPKQTACIHGADSELHQPLSGFAGEVVVFIVTSPDCPIANAMAPEMERLYQQTKTGGGRYYIVHARNDVSAKRANEHASQYGLTAPILLDRDHSLVSQLKATVTPEVVIVRLDGRGGWDTVYQGRINNLYVSLGNRRYKATEHDARRGIEAAFSGQTMDPAYIAPLGCYLEVPR